MSVPAEAQLTFEAVIAYLKGSSPRSCTFRSGSSSWTAFAHNVEKVDKMRSSSTSRKKLGQA
jgi:hypothetical protein